MPVIQRFYDNLESHIQAGKVLILYGARRVGKTTLLNTFLSKTAFKYRLDNGDNIRLQQLLSSQDFQQIKDYVSGYELIAIDEAQQVPQIGTALKIIVDHHPQIRVIATGSSSFDLSNQLGEPLTGRKQTLTLYPVSQMEMGGLFNRYELKQQLEEFLVFGAYPEIVTAENRQAKIDLLHDLSASYLFKDILALDRIRSSAVLLNLVKLLAFQIGSEVSLNELASHLGVDVKTVGRYLDLLEKSFVIIRVGGFSRNLRNEVSQKQKCYFLDNGIRNAVINQFNRLSDRNDTGQLWENFIVTERVKRREYRKIYAGMYFWRTYTQKEIDLVEEREGKLFGYEIKWSKKKEVSAPAGWLTAYENASFEVINQDNYLDFVG